MENIILTANGFENKNIGKIFLEMLKKEPSQIKVVFVPTAAINSDAIEVLPKCLHDLLDLNISKENIMANNLQDNLGYLNCKLDAHGNEGIKIGKFDPKDYSYIKYLIIKQ